VSQHRGTLFRLHPEIHRALEAEAIETRSSKVAIVEDLLRRRYRLEATAR
jgi:hypothetical protein